MLRGATKQRDDLVGTEKTMPVNESNDLAVTLRELHGSNGGGAFEAVKTGYHPATLPETEETKKA